MIYQVKLHYYCYNFNDSYEALKFAEAACRSAETPDTVEIRLIDETKEADNE